jgi:polysaccharide biosynthesis/export protein
MFENFFLSAARDSLRAGLLLGLLALCAPALSAQGMAAGPSSTESLRLRPGDVVHVEVRDEPKLACECVIDAEGQILLPLVGLVTVVGRPFGEVKREIAGAYAHELVGSELRVTPLLRIPVLGEVMRPGLVLSDPTFTLAVVVASAGGLTPSANRRAISLLRDGSALMTVSVDQLGGASVSLLSGDQVFVARRSWVQENAPILISGGVSVVAALLTALLLR